MAREGGFSGDGVDFIAGLIRWRDLRLLPEGALEQILNIFRGLFFGLGFGLFLLLLRLPESSSR